MRQGTSIKKPTIILFLATIYLWHNDLKAVINAATSGDIKSAAHAIAGAGTAAILISIYINAAISIMGVVPSVFLTGVNVLVFGLYGGFMVSWAGEVIGGHSFFHGLPVGHKIGRIPTEHWKLIKTVNTLPGVRQIYFLMVQRMAPFVPSGLINLIGSLTTIQARNFIIATTIGKFPALLLETAFIYNLININRGYINLGTGVLIAALLYFGVKKELDRLAKLDPNQ
ncbi:MAG: TVP38/TMEM64 family protein [Firmicutes bacterium]|nr:TVP38/TMEM64 family protein [Bacillota bacterium]